MPGCLELRLGEGAEPAALEPLEGPVYLTSDPLM